MKIINSAFQEKITFKENFTKPELSAKVKFTNTQSCFKKLIIKKHYEGKYWDSNNYCLLYWE